MKLSKEAIIAPEKVMEYLLKWQPDNDKSGFLRRAGYTLENWQELLNDIRNQILPMEAELVRRTHYGDMYKIHSKLVGINGIPLNVITIWMMEYNSQQTKFITLFPDKEA